MKRGKPLKRNKPLRAKTPLKRSPFKRNGKPQKSAPMPRRVKPTGPARDVVDAVYDRARHACERDNRIVGPRRGIDHHIHHRRPRAAGGTDRPDTNLPQNLLLLCPPCHEHIESERVQAGREGFLVSQYADPAEVPVEIAGRGLVYLTPDGTYSSHPPKRGDDG